jgi:hypothetical protein
MELSDVYPAYVEAVRTLGQVLVDMAAHHDGLNHSLAIYVRDELGPVLEVSGSIEASMLRQHAGQPLPSLSSGRDDPLREL